MRFFTDQYFSDAQKSKLLENSHLIEHRSVTLGDREIQCHMDRPAFYMERQKDQVEEEPLFIDEMNEPTDLSAVVVLLMMSLFGGLFVFDVLLG